MECVLPYVVESGDIEDLPSQWTVWNRDVSWRRLPAVRRKDKLYCRLYNDMMDRDMYNTSDINVMQNNYFTYEAREKMLRNGYNDLDQYYERINGERKLNSRHMHENGRDMKFVTNPKNEYGNKYQNEYSKMTQGSKPLSYRTPYDLHSSVESVESRRVNDYSPHLATRGSPDRSDYRKYYTNKTHMNEYSSLKDVDRCRPGVTSSLSFTTDSTGQGSAPIRDSFIQSFSHIQNEPIMMAADREEGAINLSSEAKHIPSEPSGTSSARAHSPESNGDVESQGQPSPQANNSFPGVSVSSGGVSKRKSRPPSQSQSQSRPVSPSTNGSQVHQSVLMLAAQQGLNQQQLQQILSANQQAGMIPPNLQQIMQAQQTAVLQQQQKVQEQALLQLNEQLQLNILQQSQLLQDKKTNGKQTQQQLQQLALQQQQLVQQIQQLQLQQRQFLLACLMQQQPFSPQQAGVLSPAEMHQIWKDIASSPTRSSGEGHKGTTNGIGLSSLNGLGLAAAAAGNPLLQGSLLGMNGLAHEAFPFAGPLIGQPQVAPLSSLKQEEESTPLYRHGLCKWPGCDTECKDSLDFAKHLKSDHTLDDKNTAQARVQMQIVSQLEIQLTREKELLHAMMQHLHLHPHREGREDRESDIKISEKLISSPKMERMSSSLKSVSSISESLPKIVKPPQSLPHLSTAAGLAPLYIPPQSSLSSLSTPSTPIPHHSSASSASQPATPTGLGPMRRRVSDKCNLPISAEIQRNREFYRTTDVRPPFTYASLIRQAIIESENKQLTLNEVYQWFQNTFAYFRRNEATWKNAVRHNLSLHKCFMRVENVKGAVWTVDEHEFYKRRPQKLTGAIPGSPSMAPDAGLYGDTINASLRQVAMFMSQHASSGAGPVSDNGMAEDLSMKSHSNSNDSLIKSESLDREDMMFLKREAAYQEDVLSSSLQQDFSNSQSLDLSPHGNRQRSPLSSQSSPKNLASPKMVNSPLLKHYTAAAENNGSDIYTPDSDKNLAKSFLSAEQLSLLQAEHEKMAEQELQSRQHNSRAETMESYNGDVKSESESSHETQGNKMEAVDTYPESPVQEQEMADEEESYRYSAADNEQTIERSQASSPYSPKAQAEQILNNQEVYSQMMHTSNMAVVSHSMT